MIVIWDYFSEYMVLKKDIVFISLSVFYSFQANGYYILLILLMVGFLLRFIR